MIHMTSILKRFFKKQKNNTKGQLNDLINSITLEIEEPEKKINHEIVEKRKRI